MVRRIYFLINVAMISDRFNLEKEILKFIQIDVCL